MITTFGVIVNPPPRRWDATPPIENLHIRAHDLCEACRTAQRSQAMTATVRISGGTWPHIPPTAEACRRCGLHERS